MACTFKLTVAEDRHAGERPIFRLESAAATLAPHISVGVSGPLGALLRFSVLPSGEHPTARG